MSKYKIVVKVELVECNDSESKLEKHDDGSFSMTISETDSISIDKCETAVLQTAYPTIRDAVSKHFSEVSKKKLMKR